MVRFVVSLSLLLSLHLPVTGTDYLGHNTSKAMILSSSTNEHPRRLKAKHEEESTTIDKVKGAKAFILLFTSGTGSTWLWQKLSVTPGVCMLGYEPLGGSFFHLCSLPSRNFERKR
jgi:hypothetical protein